MAGQPPALSVCLFTNSSAARVRAVIAPLSALAPEVVVAVDDRMPAAEVSAFTSFADRLLVAPYLPPPERGFPWLHAQCTGRWILRLDGDEVLGAGAAAELAPLVAGSEAVTHALFRRRWLFPTQDAYLLDWPWRPDWQLRLVRNDRALHQVPGTMHTSVEVTGARRYLESTIYHADLLLSAAGRRAAKAAAYDAERASARIAGRPFNEAYYLPEARDRLRTAAVPEPDRELVRALLEAAVVPGEESPRCRPEHVSRATVDASWPGRLLEGDDYRASVAVLDEGDVEVFAGEPLSLDVRVTNLAGWTWPWGVMRTPEVRLAQRWHLADGRVVDGARTLLPEPIGPGESRRVAVELSTPPAGEVVAVEVDLVHEHVRWFGAGVTVRVLTPGSPRAS